MADENKSQVAWHSLKIEKIMQSLLTSKQGLSEEDAKQRLQQYGYNELKEKKRRTALQMFFGEFKDIFILLLLAATIFSIIIGYYESLSDPTKGLESYTDSITIGIIVVLVAVTGFVQEYRAEKAMEALKKLTTPKARVIRNGKDMLIASKDIVPGDVLLLESGDYVPADARIIESIELKADESVLTGESEPVKKEIITLNPEAPLAERKNMLFTATHVVYGRGKAVVVATGMNTEFGKIAELVQTAEEEATPLQMKLNKFANKIAKVVVLVCVIIFALEAFEVLTKGWQTEGFIQAFMSSISLAISAVPEGLPAIVTISLALGAREFAKRNAIIRRLSSAESLGSVTVICSDKTGTLTKGEMTVRKAYVGDEFFEITGIGYEPKGEFMQENIAVQPKDDILLLLRVGSLCNNSHLERNDKKSIWEISGDPTEGALVVSATKAGLEKKELEELYSRIAEIPFTSERKCMTTIHKIEDEIVAYTKGAPEIILEKCSYVLVNGKEKKLDETKRKKILETNEKLAREALRVIAMAHKILSSEIKNYDEKNVEEEMVFVGLQAMIDPPREEAIQANKTCQKAGIKTVMITGDHKLTAMAVAKEIGIFKEGDSILTGVELDGLSDEEFSKIAENVSVYARVTSQHKLRIVKALKERGEIVAMTGDGVNDAPAVKRADIGISMGITGTDVTREASDMVLTDDNFATIVKAVEQGRAIYSNIRKYARFLISCNFDELLVIGSFALLGGIFGDKVFPLPLLPAMILWINLVTDGAPAVALATDPPEEGIMEKTPRKPKEGILHGMGAFILASFILQASGTFLVFSIEYYLFPSHPWGWPTIPQPNSPEELARLASLDEARTTAFVQAALFELFIVWNCRSESRSVWRMGKDALKNKFFVIATIASILLTVGITYFPVTQQMFHLVALSPTDLLYVMLVAGLGFLVLPEIFMGKKVWRWE